MAYKTHSCTNGYNLYLSKASNDLRNFILKNTRIFRDVVKFSTSFVIRYVQSFNTGLCVSVPQLACNSNKLYFFTAVEPRKRGLLAYSLHNKVISFVSEGHLHPSVRHGAVHRKM